jgi:hypothetical protein
VSHLKVWGCEAYVKRLQPSKLEPILDKCYFVGYPNNTIAYSFYHQSEGKVFVAKEFLTKEVSGRTVQLDEISESLVIVDMDKEPKVIPQIIPTTKPEVVACDVETLDRVVTEPCRSGRAIQPPEWFHNEVFILKTMNLRTTRKGWRGPAQGNGIKQ